MIPSRSCMALTYSSVTRPSATRRPPTWSIASAFVAALAPTTIADGRRICAAADVLTPQHRSRRDRLPRPQAGDQEVGCRVVQEVLEAQHDGLRCGLARALREALVGDDHVGLGRDLVHPGVDDVDAEAGVLDPLLELVGADEARAHPGLAHEHDEPHVGG